MLNKSLGIMGGTFDPIHYGHLIAAECARIEFALDRVIFIPACIPPHKDAGEILDENLRYHMVEMAVSSNQYFKVSDLEFRRGGISYTIDTIDYHLKAYPGVNLFFIMGVDSLFIMDTWKDIDRLGGMCSFIVVTRPGYNIDDEKNVRDKLPKSFWNNAHFLQIPGLDISSSDIRQRVKLGQSIKYMLPADVENYIQEKNIYLGGKV